MLTYVGGIYNIMSTKSSLFVLVIIFFGIISQLACKQDKENDFFNTSSQTVDGRNGFDTLNVEKKVQLSEIGLTSIGNIENSSGFTYIVGIKNRKIYKLDTTSLSIQDTIGHGQGQGPGEVMRLEDVAIGNGAIYAPDPRQRKIMVFNLNGDLKHEISTSSFPPKQVEYINDSRILVNAGERPGKINSLF